MEHYDFIVLGGGSGGLTACNTLSGHGSILLIESGKKYNRHWNEIPILAGDRIAKLPSVTNVSISENHNSLLNRAYGGCSEINGLVHWLGLQSEWDKLLKDSSISYRTVEQCYSNLVSKAFSLYKVPEIDYFDVKFKSFDDFIFSSQVTFRSDKFLRSKLFLKASQIQLEKYTIKPSDLSQLDKKRLTVNGRSVTFKKLFLALNAYDLVNYQCLFKSKNQTPLMDHCNMRVTLKNPDNYVSLNRGFKQFWKKATQVVKFTLAETSLLRTTGATSFGIIEWLPGKFAKFQLLRFSLDKSGSRFQRSDGTALSLSVTPFIPYYLSFDSRKIDQILDNDIRILASIVLRFLNKLGIQQQSASSSNTFEGIYHELTSTLSSGYHIAGGFGLAGSADSLLDANFMLKEYQDVYVIGSAAFGMYPSSNIEAPIIGLSSAIVNNSLKGDHENR